MKKGFLLVIFLIINLSIVYAACNPSTSTSGYPCPTLRNIGCGGIEVEGTCFDCGSDDDVCPSDFGADCRASDNNCLGVLQDCTASNCGGCGSLTACNGASCEWSDGNCVNGCPSGTTKCSDGSCRIDCGTTPGSSCNEDDTCNADEGCNCVDCYIGNNKQDSCASGLVCLSSTQKCGLPPVTGCSSSNCGGCSITNCDSTGGCQWSNTDNTCSAVCSSGETLCTDGTCQINCDTADYGPHRGCRSGKKLCLIGGHYICRTSCPLDTCFYSCTLGPCLNNEKTTICTAAGIGCEDITYTYPCGPGVPTEPGQPFPIFTWFNLLITSILLIGFYAFVHRKK